MKKNHCMDSLCDFSLKFSISLLLQKSIGPKGKMTPTTTLWLREEGERKIILIFAASF